MSNYRIWTKLAVSTALSLYLVLPPQSLADDATKTATPAMDTTAPAPPTNDASNADDATKATAVKNDDGKWRDAQGNPTYKIEADGTVDWYTLSGYLRFNSQCYVCHGPDGVGSTYAPALTDSMKFLDYGTFIATVAQGRQNLGAGAEKVMPAFGDNKNVYCYLDDIYIYLRARSVGDLPRGRPQKHVKQPQSFADAEDKCMGD